MGRGFPGTGTVRWRFAVLAGGLALNLLLAACGGSAPAAHLLPEPDHGPRKVPIPENCTRTLTDASAAQRALDDARPGERLCLSGASLRGASLVLERSGTPEAPIQLLSDDAELGGIEIDADNVVVAGFNVTGGDGIEASGDNIVLRDNDVRQVSADAGIRCDPCVGAVIERNTVKYVQGVGILLDGQQAVIRGNNVSRLARTPGSQADGIQFFGFDLVIEFNNVHDIGDPGRQAGQARQPDCFRTFDGEELLTDGVVLRNNICANVTGHCLVASGEDRQDVGLPTNSSERPSVLFVDNYCQTGAPEAIWLTEYPNVAVTGSIFSSAYTAAVRAEDGSTGLTVRDNVLVGAFAPVALDEDSRSGFHQANNPRK